MTDSQDCGHSESASAYALRILPRAEVNSAALVAGNANYGAPGDGDDLVWSETGCTCVLVTSTRDILR